MAGNIYQGVNSMDKRSVDCVVIGTGMGGATMAALLAHYGYKVLVLEKLDRVGGRIRPEYLRRWLANPKSALPYTGMPVNFPPSGPPLGQEFFDGTSIEQIEAVADLLLNFDEYITRRASIRQMIESAREAKSDGSSGGS